nr:autotransporter domain-containing protein [uncultured Methylobacterium sp.]
MTVFGDSYVDTGRGRQLFEAVARVNPAFGKILEAQVFPVYPNGRFSNGTNFIDTLQSIYRIPTGNIYNPAVGGARTLDTNTGSGFPGLSQQRQEFLASGRRLAPTDLAVLHVGGNDVIGIMEGTLGPITTPEQAAALGRQRGAVVGETVGELVRAGARTVVVGAPVDTRIFQSSSTAAFPAANVAVLAPAYSQAYQSAGIDSLVPYARSGTRIVFFDDNLFAQAVIAKPAAYGFTNATGNCLATPGCLTAPDAVKNQFFSYDGIHLTSAGFDQFGRAVANILAAPETLAVQGDVAQITATSFAGSLFARLDSLREYNAVQTVETAYSADLPGRTPPRGSVALPPVSPVSVYIQSVYGTGDRSARTGAQGFSYDSIGGLIGAEYRPAPGLLFGLAFNYADTSATLRGRAGRLDVQSYQFAGYASYTGAHLFADGVVSYGRNTFDVTRPGLAEPLRARTDGDGLTVGGKAGYLLDAGAVRLGPIVSLNYVTSRNDAYTERGESFLTLAVGRQTAEALTGGAGVQVRAPTVFAWGTLSPYVNVTAEHDFLGGRRALSVGQTVAPSLATSWQIGQGGERTYGKVIGGLAANLGSGFSLVVNAGATFARAGGNDIGASGGVTYRF